MTLFSYKNHPTSKTMYGSWTESSKVAFKLSFWGLALVRANDILRVLSNTSDI